MGCFGCYFLHRRARSQTLYHDQTMTIMQEPAWQASLVCTYYCGHSP